MSAENIEGLLEDIVGALGGVEDMEPFWILFCNLKIRHPDLLMEGNIFFFYPIFGALDALEAVVRIDIEIEGDVRLEIVGGIKAELADPVGIDAAGAALVGNG